MTIPTLSTSDKSFICSYNIGANVDFRLASGVMNEITTYTTEYIEGRCWIPVFAPMETNDHSNFWDEPVKDVVYSKVGCRISSDGYIHTWLMDTQKVSELILWNNRYNTTNQPTDDTTTLHWTVEKLYRQVIGDTAAFVTTNIKFQNYVGASHLQLFGNNTNPSINAVTYTPGTIVSGGVTWYPTNSAITGSDVLYVKGNAVSTFGWTPFSTTSVYKRINTITHTGRIYEATIAGTTGASEPSWNTNIGSITTDGSVSWRCCSTYWKANYIGNVPDSDGWAHFVCTTPWGMSPDATTPEFWINSKTELTINVPINSFCQPGVADRKYFNVCNHNLVSATGNQSGRNYGMWYTVTSTGCPLVFPVQPDDLQGRPGRPGGAIDETDNEAYIWVNSYCSGGSGSTQSACEAAGGTWIPGHYECDPSFTYDSSVAVVYQRPVTISANKIDYTNAEVHFVDPEDDCPIVALFRHSDSLVIDDFSEESGDVDNLRHFNLTSTQYNRGLILCRYTHHLGIGLATTTMVSIGYSDWVVSWGVNDYFSNWQTPDGLSARTPGTTQTLIGRPITHHDGFNTSGIDIEGGFLYESNTSNAFLSRTIDNETKIDTPLCHDTGFCWVYDFITSNAFLSRSVDVELKIDTPLTDNTGFEWIYQSSVSDAFISRTIDNETKIDTPLCHDTGFCWVYDLEEPWVSKHRFLKVGGNDAYDGLTFATAWEHWSYAMANVRDGGRLYTGHGTYNESVEMSPQKAFELFLVDIAGDDAAAEVTITPA